MVDLRQAWEGRAGQVRVGHFIQGRRRTLDDIWVITEMKNPAQIEYGHTLWWRAANTTTGLEVPIQPKLVTAKVTFMLTPAELEEALLSKRPPHLPEQWPVDSEEVLLLVEQLGATEIATKDTVTGEVTCPSYATTVQPVGTNGVDEIEHLRICHGLDVSGLEKIEPGVERAIAIAKTHGPLHGPESIRYVHKGFPHRHIPEDHSFI